MQNRYSILIKIYLPSSFYTSEENLHILFILKNILFFFLIA